jgi:hypothetical protein
VSAIIQVFKARSEGMGLNAACRVFDLAKNTLLGWERRLSGMKDTFMVYALAHTFLSQVIEGDELYTKINKNVPVEDCEGWTIVLMDRASRFIWALDCGKKDRTLFFMQYKYLEMLSGSPGFKVQNQIHSKQRFMIFFAGHAALKIRLGTSIASH